MTIPEAMTYLRRQHQLDVGRRAITYWCQHKLIQDAHLEPIRPGRLKKHWVFSQEALLVALQDSLSRDPALDYEERRP